MMVQLIDKAALVAEIENRIKELQNLHKESEEKLDSIQKTAILLCIDECKVILSSLNTLEVKEVDFEKELDSIWFDNKFGDLFDNSAVDYTNVREICKHFFELGIEKSIDESIIRKIVDLSDEAVKHYDSIINKENEENGFSQLAIDLFEHSVCPKELCIQYVIENLKAQKGE